jgi:predicted acyl esterase
MYDRNPNTGHTQGMDTELRAAHQTVFHDSATPSHITLPVVR